jgi:hypothetical protein
MSVLRHPKEEDIRDIGKGHLGISTQVQGQTEDDNDDDGYFIRFLHFFPRFDVFLRLWRISDNPLCESTYYYCTDEIRSPYCRSNHRSCGERIKARQPQQQLRQCGQGERDDDPTGCRSLQTGKNVHLQNEKKFGGCTDLNSIWFHYNSICIFATL